MKLPHYLTSAFAAFLIVLGSSYAEEATQKIGVVNVRECIENSKLGLQGKNELEKTKKQMDGVLTAITNELVELGTKLEDPDYIDSLSPEVEKELQTKVQSKSLEKAKFENQYYQVMTQANNTFVHKVLMSINNASQHVAENKNLNIIVDAETCFFFTPSIDVTTAVMENMNTSFELEQKANTEKEPQSTTGA